MNYLSEKQVQEALQLSEKQTRALFLLEDFPCFRIGRSYRIAEDKLQEFFVTHDSVKLDYSRV